MDPARVASSSTWNSLSVSKVSGILRIDDNSILNPKDVDAMMANSLNKLSFRDRTVLQEEIHGVGSLAPEEAPEMVDKALSDFQTELDKLHPDSRIFYDRAISLNSKYVHSPEFRLKFLRADLFDAKKAAMRFANYLQYGHRYFGDVALMRPLRFEDLTVEEQEMMREGIGQVLPSRDRSGRLIFFHQPPVLKDGRTDASLRARVRWTFPLRN